MGEVYLALDPELGRTVAIKILPEAFASDQQRLQRFIQEAKAASALNHPHILTIYEIGTTAASRFIATEFIDGDTLRQRISAGLKLGEILEISIQAGSALAAAHAAGIVHRDIKPDNIMIRRDGIVKVLDFGLAKLAADQSVTVDTEAATRFKTDPGTVVGTAIYMSPEQARGMAVDARTDIFSLGVMLYEMVTGCLPFKGSTSSEVMASILSEKEPQPLARYSREVPVELERIVSKALRKNSDERYQTIKDMLLDLKSLKQELEFEKKLERSVPSPSKSAAHTGQQGEVETVLESAARPTVTESGPASAIQLNKRNVVVAVAALLIITLGATAYFYFTRERSAAINSIAILPFVNASGNADVEYLSDGMTESLITSLSQLPGLSVKARSSVFRYKGKDATPQQVGKELNVQVILNGRVVQRGNDLTLHIELVDVNTETALWSQDYNRPMTNLVSLQSEIARDVLEKLRLRLTSTEQQRLTKRVTENTEAYQAYLKGRYYWSKYPAPGYEKSREYFQQAIDLDPNYALAYSGLADYYGFASAVGLLPPNENWPKAEAAANKALALDDTLAESYNPLAAVKLYYYRDWPAAERYFRRGIELNPNFAEIHLHYALCLVGVGRDEEALTEVQRAIELDPLSLRANVYWASILFFMRQYNRAIDQLRKTLELEPNFAPAHDLLGDAYEQKGMHKEAVDEWGKALTLSGASEQASILERTYAASGFEAAVRALAQQQLEKLNERMKRGEYVSAGEYVTVYTRLGDKEQAFAWLDKAVQERNSFALAIKVNPIYDKLRSDPRFADLVRRVGL